MEKNDIVNITSTCMSTEKVKLLTEYQTVRDELTILMGEKKAIEKIMNCVPEIVSSLITEPEVFAGADTIRAVAAEFYGMLNVYKDYAEDREINLINKNKYFLKRVNSIS